MSVENNLLSMNCGALSVIYERKSGHQKKYLGGMRPHLGHIPAAKCGTLITALHEFFDIVHEAGHDVLHGVELCEGAD